jgi:hypothetical protein
VGSLTLRPGDSLTIPRMALSVGFIRFVSSTNATQATGFLTITPVGLPPTEHASFSLDALLRKYSILKWREQKNVPRRFRNHTQAGWKSPKIFLRSTTVLRLHGLWIRQIELWI